MWWMPVFFIEELESDTTAYLYGSAATNSWSSARSDIDFLVFIKKPQLPQFQAQVAEWKRLGLPELDGFVCFENGAELLTFQLNEPFEKPKPASDKIQIPDLWKIQFRSRKLFGADNLAEKLPRVQRPDLRSWALADRDKYWIPDILGTIQRLSARNPSEFVSSLTPAIWLASGASRIVNLMKGGECISKQEALRLFILCLPKSEESIQLLIRNYAVKDNEAERITVAQALEIANLCLELLHQNQVEEAHNEGLFSEVKVKKS